MHELLGDSTAIMMATRESGSVAGNALKTIYSRLTTMQPAIDALKNIGINIHDSNGELKTATQILDDVAVKFKTLDDETKQNTATTLAGRFQLSRFLALVQNRNIAHEATAKALNSENSAMRENAEYMKSYKARIDKMRTAWQEFALIIGDAVVNESIISLTSLMTDFAGVFGSMVGKIGLLPPILGVIGLASGALSKNFRTLFISTVTLGNGMKSLGVSANMAKVSLRGLAASTGIGLVFVALGFALEKVVSVYAKYSDEVNKSTEAQEKSLSSLNSNGVEVNKLIKEYSVLSATKELSTEQSERLRVVQDQLNEMMPSLTASIDKQGKAHIKNSTNIAIELKHLEALQKKQDEMRLANSENIKNDLFGDISSAKSKLKSLKKESVYISEKKLDKHSIDIENQNYAVEKSFMALGDAMFSNTETLLRLKKSYESLNKEDVNYLSNLSSGYAQQIKNIEGTENQKIAYDKLGDTLIQAGEKLAKIRSMIGSAGKTFDTKEVLNLSQSQIQALNKVSSQLKAGDVDWTKHSAILASAGISYDKILKIQAGLIVSQNGLNEDVEAGSEALEDIKEKSEDYIGSLKTLNQTIKDVKDGQSLNAETVYDLIAKYPKLISEIYKTAEGWSIEESALKDLREEKLESAKDFLSTEKDKTKTLIDELKKRLSVYSIELKAINELGNAQVKKDNPFKLPSNVQGVLDGLNQSYKNEATSGLSNLITAEEAKLAKSLKDFEKHEADLKKLEDLISDPDFGAPKKGSSKSSSPYITDAYAKSLADLDYQLDQSSHAQAYLTDTSAEYSQEITKQNDLLKQKQNLMHQEAERLRSVNVELMNQRSKLSTTSEKYSELSKQIDDNEKTINGLSRTWLDLDKTIIGNTKSIVEFGKKAKEAMEALRLDAFNTKLKEYNTILEKSKLRQSLYNSTSEEARRELELQAEALKLKYNETQIEINYINKQILASDRLSDEYIKLNNYLEELTISQLSFQNALQDTEDAIKSQIKNLLSEQQSLHLEKLNKLQKDTLDSIALKIKAETEYYEDQIKLQEEKLKLLEDQIEVEDRLLKLKELNDEIDKVKKDKRFEFIDEDGNRTLTYDKGKVSELEKQRDDLLKQYERDDLKNAIKDEITRLKDSKDARLKILEEERDKTKEGFELAIKNAEDYWKKLIKSAEEGTLGFDELMNGENGWYVNTINSLAAFGINSKIEIDKIKSLYESLGKISMASPSLPTLPAGATNTMSKEKDVIATMQERSKIWHTTDSATLKNKLSEANLKDGQAMDWTRSDDGIWFDKNGKRVYHDGGIVGERGGIKSWLAKNFGGLSSNESLSKLLNGEMVIKNPINMMKNFQSLLSPAQNFSNINSKQQSPIETKNYVFNNVTIQADNPLDFLDKINFLITSERK